MSLINCKKKKKKEERTKKGIYTRQHVHVIRGGDLTS
jgi:hypothetical protein